MRALKLILLAPYACVIISTCLIIGSYDAYGLEIIGFGDSITKGTPYVEGTGGKGRRVGGYEPELEELLNNAGVNEAYVYNWGLGGENTLSGALRFSSVLEEHPEADYVLILEGTNDESQFGVDTTIRHLELMIHEVQDRGMKPVIGTLPPDTGNGSDKERMVHSEYNPAIKELAEETGTILADQYAALNPNWGSLTGDGTHPNRAGYEIMAQVWFEVISFPEATTKAADGVGDTFAVVNGVIDPNHFPTYYYFEYGDTTAYGYKTPIMDAGSEKAEIAASVSLDELSENTIYHFRLDAYNSQNTVYGEDLTFQTEEAPSSSKCFIATAAYGSELEPQVIVLKRLRDEYLLQTKWGQAFVNLYYRLSPPAAKFISNHPFARGVVRAGLYPLVGIGSLMVNKPIAGISSLLSILLGLPILTYHILWRRRFSQ